MPKNKMSLHGQSSKLMEAATALNEVQEQFIETVETETALKISAARNMPRRMTNSEPNGRTPCNSRCVPRTTCPLR